MNETRYYLFLNETINSSDNLIHAFSDLSPLHVDLNSLDFKLTNDIIILALILSMIVILTIFGNIFVLLAIFIDFHLRLPTHYLMGSLALADLLLGATVLPFSTVQQLLNYWPFGNAFCEIWLATDVLCCTASIYLVLAISIDRYIGVTRPLRYNLIMTKRRVYIIIFLIWFLSLLVSLVPFLGLKKPKSNNKICEVNDNIGYAIFSTSLSFYIPLLIILVVYYRIYKEANRQSKFLKTGRKTSKFDSNNGGVTLRVHIGPTSPTSKSPSKRHLTIINTNVLLTKLERCGPGNCVNGSSARKHSQSNSSSNQYASNDQNLYTANSNPALSCNNTKLCSNEAAATGVNAPLRKKSVSTFFTNNGSGLPSTLSSKLAKFKREKKAAKTLAIVVGCFILCWMPFFIILPIVSFCKSCNVSEKLFKIFFWLGYCNSMMNPLIYAFSSREFRKAYKGILHCNLYYGNQFTSTKAIYNSHSTNTIHDINNNQNGNSGIVHSHHKLSFTGSTTGAMPAAMSSQKLSLPHILEGGDRNGGSSEGFRLLLNKLNNTASADSS